MTPSIHEPAFSYETIIRETLIPGNDVSLPGISVSRGQEQRGEVAGCGVQVDAEGVEAGDGGQHEGDDQEDGHRVTPNGVVGSSR